MFNFQSVAVRVVGGCVLLVKVTIVVNGPLLSSFNKYHPLYILVVFELFSFCIQTTFNRLTGFFELIFRPICWNVLVELKLLSSLKEQCVFKDFGQFVGGELKSSYFSQEKGHTVIDPTQSIIEYPSFYFHQLLHVFPHPCFLAI